MGNHLMMGITYLDHLDKFLEQNQFQGESVWINEVDGMAITS
ncbi:MAG: hypothetical protein ABIP75_10525 [Pyrinomonadaceae bacterium]